MGRIDDLRRVVLAITLFLLIVSLIGSETPWVRVSDTNTKKAHELYIIDQPSCHAINSSNNGNSSVINTTQSSAPIVNTLEFSIDIYMTLLSAQQCETFSKGTLPPYIGGANLKDIRMCSDLSFDQISNFMLDVKTWDDYSSTCNSVGAFAFTMTLFTMLIITITIGINTFPNSVKLIKCSDANSKRNKIIRSVIAFIAPVLLCMGIAVYSTQCVNGDLGDVLTKRKMEQSGDAGFFTSCIAAACLWIYVGLFIFRMCDNKLNVSGLPSIDLDFKAKFINKKDKDNDDHVDAGMINERDEQRETTNSISAYDDGGDAGDNGSAYDAGDTGDGDGGGGGSAWKDVEEY